VQLISNSNIIRHFKQRDYIITLLMIAEVKEPVRYRIECDILAKDKIQHNITCTSIYPGCQINSFFVLAEHKMCITSQLCNLLYVLLKRMGVFIDEILHRSQTHFLDSCNDKFGSTPSKSEILWPPLPIFSLHVLLFSTTDQFPQNYILVGFIPLNIAFLQTRLSTHVVLYHIQMNNYRFYQVK
jgi:hypothetical protein